MKSTSADESDATRHDHTEGHIHTNESDGLPDRILSIMGGESVSAWARKCGFGESTLRGYLGGADPSRKRLVAMAIQGNVSLEWLATGREPRQRGSSSAKDAAPLADRERLAAAVHAVEEGLASIGKQMPPDRKAELICAAFDLISQGNKSAQIIQFIKLAA